MNMCSKCFGEHQKPPQPREPMSPTPPSSKPSTPLAPSVPEIKVEKKVEEKVEEPKPEESQAGPSKSNDKPKKKIQKNRGRCFSCRKKVGLTGFECKCGYVFCGEHRYSDKHDCDFDYRENAREQLKKANPVIVAEKLEKI